jgi:NAD(P)-dependent dehydrogenase (short-subunit alcohol dehydrogenase family)
LDVLVNNAGVMPQVDRDLVTCVEEEFEYTIGVNVFPPISPHEGVDTSSQAG